MDVQIEEMQVFVKPLGFELNNDKFENKNLVIYYRESHKEWRLKDTSAFSSMDLITINFPLNEEEQLRVRKCCSENYNPKILPLGFNCEGKILDNRGNIVGSGYAGLEVPIINTGCGNGVDISKVEFIANN